MYEDRELVCQDCGETFVFESGEQEFFAEKGFTEDPIRCRECRTQKKKARRERISHPAVCAECGVETMVPFVPKEDRPVYCSECFAKIQEAEKEAEHTLV